MIYPHYLQVAALPLVYSPTVKSGECPSLAVVFISFLATQEKAMCLQMSLTAAEVSIKLPFVLEEKKPIQSHSELNALDGNSVGLQGPPEVGISHILTH